MSENAVQPISDANIEEFMQDSTVVPKVVPTADMSTVLLHNDEVTPYEYVINILGDLFMLSEELADHIAWTAHNKGTAVVVTRPRMEAEKLVKVARGRARTNGYPLTFTLEQS
jgi:ATP-dependent Clp protease adaptor protein ClpS